MHRKPGGQMATKLSWAHLQVDIQWPGNDIAENVKLPNHQGPTTAKFVRGSNKSRSSHISFSKSNNDSTDVSQKWTIIALGRPIVFPTALFPISSVSFSMQWYRWAICNISCICVELSSGRVVICPVYVVLCIKCTDAKVDHIVPGTICHWAHSAVGSNSSEFNHPLCFIDPLGSLSLVFGIQRHHNRKLGDRETRNAAPSC